MYCSKCNTLNEENHKFCHNCGSELTVEQEPVEEKVQNSLRETAVNELPEIQTSFMQEVQVPESENIVVDEKPAKKKENNTGKLILSILCSILIFVLTVTTLSIVTFRGSISKERVENVIDGINVREALEDEEIKDAIFIDLRTSDAVAIYEDGTLKEFIEEIAFDCCEYILGGEKPADIYSDDIVELMEDNEEIIFEETGELLNDKDYEKIEEMGEELEEETEINRAVKLVRMICSILVIVVLSLLIILVILLLFKVRKKNIDTMLWIGSTLSAAAILSFIAGIVMTFAFDSVFTMGALADMIVKLYMTELTAVLLINSGILLLIGALMIFIYQIVRRVKKVNA